MNPDYDPRALKWRVLVAVIDGEFMDDLQLERLSVRALSRTNTARPKIMAVDCYANRNGVGRRREHSYLHGIYSLGGLQLHHQNFGI